MAKANWYALLTPKGREGEARQSLLDYEKDLSQEEENHKPLFEDIFVLPVQHILLHGRVTDDDVDLAENEASGLVFVLAESDQPLRKHLPTINFHRHLRLRLLYDRIRECTLVVPDVQMNAFRRLHHGQINEFVILTKPFNNYVQHNERYYVLSGPFEGLEGYRIDLHKQKKLAMSFGGMTVAVNNLYQYPVIRVFERHKDKIFSGRRPEAILTSLLLTLQQYGFPDNAPQVLRNIIMKSHLLGDDFNRLEAFYTTSTYDLQIANWFRCMDALTAGQIKSLSGYYFSVGKDPDLQQQIPDDYQIPFLTVSSGLMTRGSGKPLNDTIPTIHHHNYDDIICPVRIEERIPLKDDPMRSTSLFTVYYAHIRQVADDQNSTVSLSLPLETFAQSYLALPPESRQSQLKALETLESPLAPAISRLEAEGTETFLRVTVPMAQRKDAITELVNQGQSIIQHLQSSPRLAFWRSLLPEVWNHN